MNGKEKFNLKILYVEDEIDTLEPMTRFLQRRFSTVITAVDGEDGWKKINEFYPDIIITDLLIPEFSGVDLIRKIRETGNNRPIIITSALQDAETIVKTVDYGICKYIIKPINFGELDEILEKLGLEALENKNKYFDMTFAEKKDCEMKLRFSISNLIKQYTGKGPKAVAVLIGSEHIRIKCTQLRTVLENTLYQNGNNAVLIEQNRRLLYRILKRKLEEAVSASVDSTVQIVQIDIDLKSDSDIIVLKNSAG